MGFVIAALGLALGCLIILIGNPVQVMPRFMHPLHYVVVSRGYQRLRANYRIRRRFLQLIVLAAGLLIMWFFIAILAPIREEMLLSRIVLGTGLGGFLGWSLFCKHELLLGKLGITGFYPSGRLIVTWNKLAGYLVLDEKPRVVVLVGKSGAWLEMIPIKDDLEQREVELALLPYLQRLDAAAWPLTELAGNAGHLLVSRYLFLLVGTLPLVLLLAASSLLQYAFPDWCLIAAIVLAIAVPAHVLNWSLWFHWSYYSHKGHVSLARFSSLCQRCFYQSVCWQSGLRQRVYLKQDGQARVPTWEEFCKEFGDQTKITQEVYNTCCRCLVGHLQAKDLYQVTLVPVNPLEQDEEN